MMDDPLLTKYSVIIMDEAHERSINTELALGLLRKVMSVRNDLRLIVSSATIDAEVLAIMLTTMPIASAYLRCFGTFSRRI